MSICHICRSQELKSRLDLGPQPICNRFLAGPDNEEYTQPIVIGQCDTCGLVQLVDPVPAKELIPRYDWISYNEPEGHLDALADIVWRLPGLTSKSTVCGISFKDESTLRRLRERGLERTWRIDPAGELGIGCRNPGVETIQDRLTPDTAGAIAEKHGTFDVVMARHILEHAHDLRRFLEAVRKLVKRQGYVVFEVPDCTLALQKCDYTTIWEEHIAYFTPETFRRCFGCVGLQLVRFELYPYPFENSLVGILQPQERKDVSFSPDSVVEKEKRRFRLFSERWDVHRAKFGRFFAEYRKQQGNIALFGAGHLGCTFINFLDLQEHIDFVVDDHPNKLGLFMPGSRLPILGSPALLDRGIKLCLLSVSPESETKVLERNKAFVERGGTFASIFPASKYALRL